MKPATLVQRRSSAGDETKESGGQGVGAGVRLTGDFTALRLCFEGPTAAVDGNW